MAATGSPEEFHKLLQRAVQETLTEAAKGKESVDSIVHGVSARILAEVGAGSAIGAALPAVEEEEVRPAPLLADLRAQPWVMWRGAQCNAIDASGSLIARSAPSSPLCAALLPDPERTQVGAVPAGGFLECLGDGGSAEDADSVPEDASRIVRTRTVNNDSSLSPPDLLRTKSSFATRSSYAKSTEQLGVARSTAGDMRVVRNGLSIESNTAQHLMMKWPLRPKAVLIVAKRGDIAVLERLRKIVDWCQTQGLTVILEPQLLDGNEKMRNNFPKVRTFSKGDALEQVVDLVVTLGGDGTLCWATNLFDGPMPPVLSFAAGSLGFLTPFPLDNWKATLSDLLDLRRTRKPTPLVCRMRLIVAVHKKDSCDADVETRVLCLNEVLVHRGSSGSLAKLEVKVDGERVTLVQGDGIILSTPTGSTAYSLAAGGSMVHPAVPGILLTPVSPHSLSFRPALLPNSSTVTISVPPSARADAAVSVDGKDVCTLSSGDSLEVAMSPHPVPTICRTTETVDWFASVHEALHWNRRAEQK